MNFGVEQDIKYCLTADNANVLPVYVEGKLVSSSRE
jgi:phosphosulfolactate phosphohydrolase-like enzyme